MGRPTNPRRGRTRIYKGVPIRFDDSEEMRRIRTEIAKNVLLDFFESCTDRDGLVKKMREKYFPRHYER